MEISHWFWEVWHGLLGDVGVIASVTIATIALFSDNKTSRVSNLLTLTQNHHELLKPLFRNADLSRVQDTEVDLEAKPLTEAETAYINVRIQHLFSAYRAMQDDLTIRPEGFEADIRDFFSLPLPKAVWDKIRPFQNRDFVAFVESTLK